MGERDKGERGPFKVGVVTAAIPFDDRDLAVELWYPSCGGDSHEEDRFTPYPGAPEVVQSAARHAEMLEDGNFPLLLFSHGGLSHRRAMSHLCTHAASHGYVVASLDHPGSLYSEYLAALQGQPATLTSADSAKRRPRELVALVKAVRSGRLGVKASTRRIGSFGASFGGWTALQAATELKELASVVALVPAFGEGPLIETLDLTRTFSTDWVARPDVLLVAGEFDAFVPPNNVRALFERLAEPKRLEVIADVGHNHFVDGAEQIHELLRTLFQSGMLKPTNPNYADINMAGLLRPFGSMMREADAHLLVRRLLVAHMDKALKRHL
ncbi:alpha/beta hydrolase family protein [Sphingomonas sp. CCH18-H6]|uniref:alpha/beta hydrolase family protein n=1 Tax=Sphingomonas sp. CCH18-H6 TaxID=1768787 RepID=UPI0008372D28|nr:dienelactone hydrolase family protein [Sphingomonas sp. CCH18-H6]